MREGALVGGILFFIEKSLMHDYLGRFSKVTGFTLHARPTNLSHLEAYLRRLEENVEAIFRPHENADLLTG